MRRSDKRSLPVLVAMAAIMCFSGLILAQSSTVNPPDAAQNASASAPKPAATSAASTATPAAPPTFEQLGDALMAHQRYQEIGRAHV